jgi:DNA repair exonuclease SbcCD ATPase subunit
VGANEQEKLANLCDKTHKEQIIWFLNAFWNEYSGDSEKLWLWKLKCDELDLQNHENGTGLDELNAHRFLEHFNEPMTVREMRDTLRSTGAIGEKPIKIVPITHILIFKYKASWHELISRSQGDNREELQEAQRLLDSVLAAFKESESRAREAAAALAEANAREAEARRQEAPFKAAQEEVESALSEVKKEEDSYNGKIQDCIRRSEEGGVVSRNKAKAELAQLKAEDPLPLRKAKITLEAAMKRAEKARAPFEAATAEAAAARDRSARAADAAEDAVRAAQDKVNEAENYLHEVKNKPGQPMGALWWIDRELEEAKKYLPESKGGVRRK